ncbi:very short patch repair endonuclease [Massilia eurypsychrophila]|uniref:Very short patch repair endonuclease n=1 Tax=Massilia eurypsychrophila TaxID=1485217 RepID=A0A2G8TKX4_9BURK|nr:very short patch repair endonuclease [Massilia eurypsychrophila]PIL46639.1 very short patch repair endonuclease [Massilia eurypsychrophila]
MDSVDAITRSRIMRAVRQRDTGPELAIRRELHRQGLRYRLHSPSLPGRPDIVFVNARVAVFVHGCFWHRHLNCRLASTPKTRQEFWLSKFAANIERDERNKDLLIGSEWEPVFVWQCEIQDDLPGAVRRIVEVVRRRTAAVG